MSNIETIKAQITILVDKYNKYIPHPSTGKYDSGYYKLRNKIKNLKREVEAIERKKKWNDFLAR